MTENTRREDSAWIEIDRLKNQLSEVEGEVRWRWYGAMHQPDAGCCAAATDRRGPALADNGQPRGAQTGSAQASARQGKACEVIRCWRPDAQHESQA